MGDQIAPIETIPAKTLVTKTKKPAAWFGADFNMNIYRGCTHGCIYCDSRSECYRNPDFDSVRAKHDALMLLRDELRRKSVRGVIATGAMSDPYNPFERTQLLTRHALELINAYEFGAAIDTKGALAARDADVLRDIARHSPVIVKMTITTADDSLCALLEPGAAVSSERFVALKALADAGIYCGVLLMPLLPFINDSEKNVLAIVRAAKDAGARFVYPSFGVTMRAGNREYFYAALDRLFPGMKERYIAAFGERYMCNSPNARQLGAVFKTECERLGLLCDMLSITRGYKLGYGDGQLSMF